MKRVMIISMVCLLTSQLYAQRKENIWRTLALMKYEREDSQSSGGLKAKGHFISMIEALEGKEITLKGYIVPLSGKKAQSHFMFSAYPYENCFFCGKAGPESVVEVFTAERQKIPYSDKAVFIKGIFKFTSRNPEGVMFTLENATLADE